MNYSTIFVSGYLRALAYYIAAYASRLAFAMTHDLFIYCLLICASLVSQKLYPLWETPREAMARKKLRAPHSSSVQAEVTALE